MLISKELAQKIIDAIEAALDQEINFIDKEGFIIASSDKKRIGQQHIGATQALKNKTELVVHSDNDFDGARKGINIPIFFENEIVGVIGITGEPEIVQKYLSLLKNMTEILIKEAYMQNLTSQEQEINRLVLEYILFPETDSIIEPTLFSFDPAVNRIVAVAELKQQPDVAPMDTTQILQLCGSLLTDKKQEICLLNNNMLLLILHYQPKEKLTFQLNQLQKQLDFNGITSRFGVGTKTNSIASIRESYEKAVKALESKRKTIEASLFFYDDLTLGFILTDLSPRNQKLYVDKILSGIPKDELPFFKQLFSSYCRTNGNLANMADELFIHKNTVQYQIKKLTKLTGYNLRVFEEFTLLHIAFTLVD